MARRSEASRLLVAVAAASQLGAAQASTLVVERAHPMARFDPETALGAGLDGMEAGGLAGLFTPTNLKAMERAGLGPVAYRLRTELAIEAWHFTSEGSWSDPARRQGYWTSSDDPRAPVLLSFGYRLPRRGDTIDNAADDGFSRLDDGDRRSFWKSDPYLDPLYTGQRRPRPQWVVASFPKAVAIDTAIIDWAAPFGRTFEVQYWVGADAYDDAGRWVTFPGGAVGDGQGGRQRLNLAQSPIRSRFFRILLERSSRTAPPGATDRRDFMGYAIAELGLGRRTAGGGFIDAIRHAPSRRGQTIMTVSSTDPWHRAVDRDPGLEQPGLDLVFRSGLTRGLPLIVPVGALYDTPENAAAEVSFLRRRRYPLAGVEIGEEPDGQGVDPETYGALFLEFAAAVRAADPAVPIGGPSLQSAVSDTALNSDPDRSWNGRLIAWLKRHGALDRLQFFSFERYPFDDLCGDLSARLAAETAMMRRAFVRLKGEGVPSSIPWIISEYGFSAFGGRGEVLLPGALVDADIAAQFVSLGGKAAYLFGYGPSRPYEGGKPCAGFGNLMLFEADASGQAHWPMPTFFESRMLTGDWAGRGGPGGASDTAYPARLTGPAAPFVVAYPLKRADGRWSVLIINRSARRSFSVRLAFDPARPSQTRLDLVQYGKAQYAWRAAGPDGHPVKDRPPRRFSSPASFTLPPWSLTVATTRRGRRPS